MGSSSEQMLEWATMEEPLSERERDLRDLFVSEYMKDFDVFNATVRTGFQPVFALEWGRKLYSCPYVQRALTHLKRKPSAQDENSTRAEYENNLRFLMYNGSESSRVAASKAYAEFKGWAKPEVGDDAAIKLIEAFKSIAATVPV